MEGLVGAYCPYCGSYDNEIEEGNHGSPYFKVRCNGCEQTGPIAGDPEKAFDLFNTRVNITVKKLKR